MLERGGNAFDAAVAAAFVLHVVEPHLNGPGGDLVALIRPAGTAEPVVLMGQGPAPAGASIEALREWGLDLVPGAGASLPRCRAPLTPGYYCCATTARGISRTSWPTPSVTPANGHPLVAAPR